MKVRRFVDILRNELALLWYSVRMLVGRNLLAVGIISLVLLGAVFSFPLGARDTKLAILIKQLEMFAPLLGIVIFSDLIASDVQARRATLLMSSRYGITPVVIRKLVHGLIITTATYAVHLLVLRLFYTSFEPVTVFAITVPGALYFGMIGLLGATFTSRALAGYATGTAALVLSMVATQIMPLTPASFQLKEKLANATLFGDLNWVFVKAVFVLLAGVLAVLVVVLASRRTLRVRIVVTAGFLLGSSYIVLHTLWSRATLPDIYVTGPGKQLEVIQNDGELIVRTATSQAWGRGKKKRNEETALTDTLYKSENGRWVQQQSVEYDPTKEYELVHVNIDADVAPRTCGIDAKARADVKVLAPSLHKVYLHLGWELQVTQVDIAGQRTPFSRYGDLVEILLAEPARQGQELQISIEYGGNLRLPGGRHRSERSDKNTLFVNSRWYPFTKSWYHKGRMDTCTFDVRVTAPRGWRVGAGERIASQEMTETWRFGTDTPCDRIALLVTRLPRYETRAGDIAVTVFGHSMSEAYMAQIGQRACDALQRFESAFGTYPHRNLAIVEYDHMGASGVAVPSIVLVNARCCRPENKSDMLNELIPHEISHQWHSSALPTWVAETSAVYSNYLYLRHAANSAASLAGFHGTLSEVFEQTKHQPKPLFGASGMTVYTKGGYLPIMLTSLDERRTLATLRSFIQEQLKQQIVDKDASAESFVEALNRAAGSDWSSFVNAWVHSADRFDPAVTAFTQSRIADGFKVKASLVHREKIRFPTPARIVFEDGTHHDTTWTSPEARQTLEWTFDKPARSIVLDPDHVLLDWDRFNNTRRVGSVVASASESNAPEKPATAQVPRWTTYTVADGLLSNHIRYLDTDAQGRLLAGLHLHSKKSGTYVQCFDGRWTQPDTISHASGPVSAGTVGHDGAIWTSFWGRLRRITEDETTMLVMSQVRERQSMAIGKGVLRPNPAANSNIAGYSVYDMSTDRAGNIWVATDNGVSVLDPRGHAVEHMTTEDGLPGNEVLCMAWTDEDVLWVGTDKGCASYQDGTWRTYPKMPRGIVMSIAADAAGNVYLGTYRKGVIVYDGQTVRRLDVYNSRLPHNMITALLCDRAGRLWIGTGQGLLCVEGYTQHLYTKDNCGLLSNQVTALAADGRYIYVGTDQGIAQHDGSASDLSRDRCGCVAGDEMSLGAG